MKRKSVVPSSADAALRRRTIRRSLSLLSLGAAAILAVALRGTSAASGTVVRRVVDGDTIELSDGRHVRYIGIDTPETRRRVGARWVSDPQPFGREATRRNRELVEGRRVRLELDVQTHDRYDRWLAYVYVTGAGQPGLEVGKEIMVNAQLLLEGFAQPLTIPPNVAHAEWFRQLAEAARRTGRGLWRVR